MRQAETTDTFADPFRDGQRARAALVFGMRTMNFTTVTRGQVGGAEYGTGHCFGDPPQAFVAGLVPVAVVVALEEIDV